LLGRTVAENRFHLIFARSSQGLDDSTEIDMEAFLNLFSKEGLGAICLKK
jgi:hypothetical protein